MSDKHYAINKYASLINRLGMIYFDHKLAPYTIASGQLFFLLHISEAAGISILELASQREFDKGTTTRAVQKLEELGYVYRQSDVCDRRIQRLYVSTSGMALIPIIREVLHEWESKLLLGLKEEDILLALHAMQAMANNASHTIQEGKRDHYE